MGKAFKTILTLIFRSVGQGLAHYQQMMGRAGRPQYDTSGTVVVMCNRTKVERVRSCQHSDAKFRDMLHSRTILESSLHNNLTERMSQLRLTNCRHEQ